MRIKNKKNYKEARGKCNLCGESDINLLDVHRIYEGHKGGTYDYENTVCLCANCHRKVHSGKIKITRKYKSLSHREYIEVIENGQTRMVECT